MMRYSNFLSVQIGNGMDGTLCQAFMQYFKLKCLKFLDESNGVDALITYRRTKVSEAIVIENQTHLDA